MAFADQYAHGIAQTGRAQIIRAHSEIHIVLGGVVTRSPVKDHVLYYIRLSVRGSRSRRRRYFDQVTHLVCSQGHVVDADIINQTAEEISGGAIVILVKGADGAGISAPTNAYRPGGIHRGVQLAVNVQAGPRSIIGAGDVMPDAVVDGARPDNPA